jgi:hypothetical protein
VGNLAPRNGGLSDSHASGLPAMSGGAKRGSILRRGFPVLNQKSCSLEELNHFAWAGQACITAFGLRVGVRVTAPEFLDRFLGGIPARWKCAAPQSVDRLYSFIARAASPRVDVRGAHLLYANSQRLARTGDLSQLVEMFESDLNSYIAQPFENCIAARNW